MLKVVGGFRNPNVYSENTCESQDSYFENDDDFDDTKLPYSP